LFIALFVEQLSEVLPWHILRGFAMLFPDPLVPKLSDSVRQQDGSLISMEWRRELPDAEAPTERSSSEDIPYGLRISNDCQRLEVDPTENKALILMMDLLAQDFSYSSIVSDLNEKGFRMRNGELWSRVAVQHDAAPHRGWAPPLFHRGLEEAVREALTAKEPRGS
jgi:hypothetical protein